MDKTEKIMIIKENEKWQVAWDKCHKIFICENKKEVKEMEEYGYVIFPSYHINFIWESSCYLRFISNASLKEREYCIEQFE